MKPERVFIPFKKRTSKFKDQVVLISGGDSGIGRAVALAFASEAQTLRSFFFNEEDTNAFTTKQKG